MYKYREFYNKFDEIDNYLLNNRHIDILALTESRKTKNITDNELKIDDFDLIRYNAAKAVSPMALLIPCDAQ